jgi:putative hydrolase of the HAD superfamily
MSDVFGAINAVVFDLDDTLCTYWDAAKAGLRATFKLHPILDKTPEEMLLIWGSAYREFGPTIKTTEWYNEYLHSGEPTRIEQMRRTLAEVGVVNEGLAKQLSDTYAFERKAALKLFPESLSVLHLIRARYPLGLLTNGPADIQREEIARLGIESFFDGIFIEGEMEEGKPESSVFYRVALHFECQPSELLMVGNSYYHDIMPAVELGWHTAWIRRPSDVPPSADPRFAVPEERPKGGPTPDVEMGSLDELLGYLDLA